jgi:hypothetical protein
MKRNPKITILIMILTKAPVKASEDCKPFLAKIEPTAHKKATKIARTSAIILANHVFVELFLSWNLQLLEKTRFRSDDLKSLESLKE